MSNLLTKLYYRYVCIGKNSHARGPSVPNAVLGIQWIFEYIAPVDKARYNRSGLKAGRLQTQEELTLQVKSEQENADVPGISLVVQWLSLGFQYRRCGFNP